MCMRRTDTSAALFERASRYIPGGVNSPVRAFRSVGLTPLYIDHGKGAHVFDADGNEYIDYISSWGPLLLGHAYPPIQEAIRQELEKGTSYGACNAREVEMAELICTQFFPSVERVRMVNSGTEATMSAVRLARGFTGRDKIIKFEGCYHGHADTFLISAGSGLATFGQTSSAGVTKHIIEDTLVATYNDIESVRRLLETHRGEGDGGICQDSVPQAIICALQAKDFEDAIRNAISIGGDSDTIGCIAGGIAEALYGIPESIKERAWKYLDETECRTVRSFIQKYSI